MSDHQGNEKLVPLRNLRDNAIAKGPDVQGAPKMLEKDEQWQSTARLQKLATIHSQQHGITPDGGVDFFHKMREGDDQENDYEHNT